jgi:PEP-CTERM motif
MDLCRPSKIIVDLALVDFVRSVVSWAKHSAEKAIMKKMLLLAGVLGLGVASGAQGSVAYSYMAQLAPGQTLTPGSSATVNVYLAETDTSGSAEFVVGDGGLYSAGAAFVEQAGGQGVTVTAVTNNSAAEPAGFSGNDNKGSGTYGAYMLDITNNASTTPPVTPTSSTTVGTTRTDLYLLGTVTLALSTAPNATFNVESIHDAPAPVLDSSSNGNTLTFNGDDLDTAGGSIGTGANGHPTPFAVVPEPASIGLLSLGALGLLARRRTAH